MKKNILFLLLLSVTNSFFAQKTEVKSTKGEVIYHVCQRSFYDSNGDLNGDLKGLRQQLDYLQDLGITSILLLPLYEADCYHNYFANDFEKIDSEFGSMQDFIDLVKDVHQRGMKIYMDMETQYVTDNHLWWKDAVGNLNSPYSDYILFDDAAHTSPATMIFDLRVLHSYDGKTIRVTTVNLKNEKVLDYNTELFSYFLDPNKDGKFDDGVDGFRLDHAMDHLDAKPTLTNLFAEFWSPLITALKEINPSIKIVAEQADWSDYGFDYFARANVDRVFGFGLQKAILTFDKQQIINKADTILKKTPKGNDQLIFIENHDIDRFASVVTNLAKQKVAASIMLLIGGIPSIYYGQEIGMQGKVYAYGNTDGNDIGRREAFDWYQKGEGTGMSFWYKNSGNWWNTQNLKPNDGISLEEQQNDPNSLYACYKKTIQLKQSNAALATGNYENASNNNEKVISFYRYNDQQKVLVVINLTDEQQVVRLHQNVKKPISLLDNKTTFEKELSLKPYEITVWKVN
jgi:glycosidase